MAPLLDIIRMDFENLHCGNCMALYWTLLEWILIFHMGNYRILNIFRARFEHDMLIINRLKFGEKPSHSQLSELFGDMQVNDLICEGCLPCNHK